MSRNPSPWNPPQIHLPGEGLPNLQPNPWPYEGIDPRGYFPGYTPGNKGDPYIGFGNLSLGSKNQTELSFGADLQQLLGKTPQAWVVTIIPDTQALLRLASQIQIDGSHIHFFYKVQYIFDTQYPAYIEGSFNNDPASVDGYLPLSIRGVKIQLRGWATKIWIKAVGTLGALPGGKASNWQTLGVGGTPLNVRFDGFLSPYSGAGGKQGNADAFEIGEADDVYADYLPTFSYRMEVPVPSGVAGTFTFLDLSETLTRVYAVGATVPIPPWAYRITSTVANLGALVDKY